MYVPGIEIPFVEPGTPSVGVVLEGGGFRGMYTAGVLDVWMKRGFTATATVGVSAGATFGCNFKSMQVGRTLRYNKRFCADPRYAGVGNLVRTGDLFSRDFAYSRLPWELDVFDTQTFQAHPCASPWLPPISKRASRCTMTSRGRYGGYRVDPRFGVHPALSRPVYLEGRKLLDGGTADSIPFEWMLGQGYDRCVVVCTQDPSYRKKPNNLMPVLRMRLHRYPKLVELLANRHDRYNAQREKLAQLEAEGRVFVIRPSEPIVLPTMVRDPELLQHVYEVGCRDAVAAFDALMAYVR